MSGSGKYPFNVRSYELGTRGRASLASVCHYLQEAASLHAHELHASPEELHQRDMTWFLSRMRARVERYPSWRDRIRVETWPSGVLRPFAFRDFRVFDDRGEVIAIASTSWLLMDLVRRKPLWRLPPDIAELHPDSLRMVMPAKTPRVRSLVNPTQGEELRLRASDLDWNGHVNHVFYIAQAEQAVPAEIRSAHEVTELDIEFKAECHEGDELTPLTEILPEEGTWLHSLRRSESEEEVSRARVRWHGAAPRKEDA